MSDHDPKDARDSLVARLRDLLDRATPGPWGTWAVEDDEGHATNGVQGATVPRPGGGGGLMTLNVAETKQGGEVDAVDALLIAALRNAAPDLLRVVEAAQAWRDKAPGEIDVDLALLQVLEVLDARK